MLCQRLVASAALLIALAVAVRAAEPAADIMRTPDTEHALQYRFTPEDEKLLEEIEHACFLYFWNEVGEPSKLVKDRLKGPVSSIAAVGFQLASLPIGVEHGWITRDQGETRAKTVLESLIRRHDNKKFGVYLHYPDLNTGGLSHEGYELVASTVDHAWLLSGAMTAASYFGGDVAHLVDRMIADTNWKAFAVGPNGFLSMGWRPKDPHNIDGPGEFLKLSWFNASAEELQIYFLAVGSPNPDHAIDPAEYYRLGRPIRRWKNGLPFVVSYPGAMFTYVFHQCFIDYRDLEADDPRQFGIDAPRVDWFENSRRAALSQRLRAIELGSKYKTLSADRWGLSACDGPNGYIVPEIGPNLADREQIFDGTIAPYAAGTAIMFAPAEGVAALRAFRALKDAAGKPLVWRDPRDGGYGLADAFNLDRKFVSGDYLGIDHGPLLVAIENARTGLIWKLFMEHPAAQRSIQRLKLRPRTTPSEPREGPSDVIRTAEAATTQPATAKPLEH